MEPTNKFRFQPNAALNRISIGLPPNLREFSVFFRCLEKDHREMHDLLIHSANFACPGHCDVMFQNHNDYLFHVAEVYQLMVKCIYCKEQCSFNDIREEHRCYRKSEDVKEPAVIFEINDDDITNWTGSDSELEEVNEKIIDLIKYLNRHHPGEIVNMEIYIGFTTLDLFRRISQHRGKFTIFTFDEVQNPWSTKNHMLRCGRNMVQAEMDILSHALLDLHMRRSVLDDGREKINGIIPRLANTQFKFETQHEGKFAMIYAIIRKKENETPVNYSDIWAKGLGRKLLPRLACWYTSFELPLMQCLKIAEKECEQYGEGCEWMILELRKLIWNEYRFRGLELNYC